MKETVRIAKETDAPAIGQVQAVALTEAISAGLGHSLSPGTKAAFDPAHLAGTWRQTMANLPTPEHKILVALADEHVQGFAAMAPVEPIESGPAFEITNLDVPATFASRQHEARLLAAITDYARESNATELHMWAIAGHDWLTKTLDAAGFAPRGLMRTAVVEDGEVTEHLWWTLLEVE